MLLILDSTNLGRHLVLAAPILALGLPTLIVLNMADDLEGRGGEVDAEALSQQLGAPGGVDQRVARRRPRHGDGISERRRMHARSRCSSCRFSHDIPQCRRWAARAGEELDITRPRLRSGRGGWMPSSCIR